MGDIRLGVSRPTDGYGNDYKNSKKEVTVPQKNDIGDNVVHVDSTGFTKDDFIAAANNAKANGGVMFVKTEKDEIYRIDVKGNNGKFIDEALAKLEKKENFSLKLDIVDSQKTSITGFCQDFQSKASGEAAAGTDPQYKVLAASPSNYLNVDPKNGNINGYYNSSGNLLKLPDGMKTNIKDVIIADFARYGSEMTKKFPNNEEGAKNFLEALKTIPGNSDNKNLNLENAKDLLSYIHTGANTAKGSNVQELQRLLQGMTGTKGVDISGKNNPVGGDDRYGYATTLQVRSLDAFLAKEYLPDPQKINPDYFKPQFLQGNPVFMIDRSKSMEPEINEMSNTLGNSFKEGSNYRIATYQDGKGIDNDLKWVTKDNGKGLVIGSFTNESSFNANQAKAILGKQGSNFDALYKDYGIGMVESGITNAITVLSQIPDNTGKPKENLIMFTDEPDTIVINHSTDIVSNGKTGAQQAEAKLDQMVNDANAKNYKPVVVFHNDKRDEYVAIDLSTLKDQLSKNKASFKDILSDKNDLIDVKSKTMGNCVQLDFNKVADKLGLQWEKEMKHLKF